MDWRRGRILGHGSTATVSLASSPTTTQLFAVKSAPLSKSQPLQLENHLFSSFITPSPYIISYHGHTISHQNNQPPSYNLFIEYLPGGILTQIHNPSTIQLYTWRILMGIHHLHSLGIVHGDIKPANILIGVTGPKIADFGCAHLTHNNNNNSLSHHHHHFSGTPLYMAPEVARGEKQDLASDIWSFGITIIEMITGKSPWTMNFNPISFIYKIGYCTSNHQPNLLDQCLSEHAKDFFTKCLMIQPNQRWTAAELLKHPFLNRFTQPQLGGFQQLKFQFHPNSSSNSPTSVLEQGFSTQDDDQEEDIYTSSSFSFMSSVFLSENVGHRMLALFDSEEMVLPKWELDDQDWITIR